MIMLDPQPCRIPNCAEPRLPDWRLCRAHWDEKFAMPVAQVIPLRVPIQLDLFDREAA